MFNKALSYWDGYGFNDTHLGDCYQTYHLALCLCVANKIHHDLSDLGSVLQYIIWALQGFRSDGGVSTGYTKYFVPYGIGEPNCETVSFCVLAYKNPYFSAELEIPDYLKPEFILGCCVAGLVFFGAKRRFF